MKIPKREYTVELEELAVKRVMGWPVAGCGSQGVGTSRADPAKLGDVS